MDDKKSISEVFSNIDAYLFKYKPEAQDKYGMDEGVDDREHFGIMAQELAENPVTQNTVVEDEEGVLSVDNNQLTMTLTAVVSDLAKRVNELENKINNIIERIV